MGFFNLCRASHLTNHPCPASLIEPFSPEHPDHSENPPENKYEAFYKCKTPTLGHRSISQIVIWYSYWNRWPLQSLTGLELSIAIYPGAPPCCQDPVFPSFMSFSVQLLLKTGFPCGPHRLLAHFTAKEKEESSPSPQDPLKWSRGSFWLVSLKWCSPPLNQSLWPEGWGAAIVSVDHVLCSWSLRRNRWPQNESDSQNKLKATGKEEGKKMLGKYSKDVYCEAFLPFLIPQCLIWQLVWSFQHTLIQPLIRWIAPDFLIHISARWAHQSSTYSLYDSN